MNIMTILDDKPPSLTEAQQFVGGYVELIELANGDQLLVDEEGKLKQLEPNEVATLLALPDIVEKEPLVGPALLLRGTARWV